MTETVNLSTYRFPTGWFIAGFSSELGPGEVNRAHHLGGEWVIVRTESGQVNLLDTCHRDPTATRA